MKKILVLLVTLLYFLTISLTCFAVKIDGSIDGVEWRNSKLTEIFSPGDKTGCNIDFAWFQSIYDQDNNILYLSFSETEKSSIEDGENISVSFSINGEEKIIIGSNNQYPTALYDVRSALKFGDDTFMAEAEIVLKKPNYKSISLLVSFTDSNGVPSASRSFDVFESTSQVEESSIKDEKTTKPKTNKKKTTKPKTTKAKTTKSKGSSKYNTVKYVKNNTTKKNETTKKTVKSTTEAQTEIINNLTTKPVQKNEAKSDKGKAIKIVAISMIVLVAAGYIVTVSRNKKS